MRLPILFLELGDIVGKMVVNPRPSEAKPPVVERSLSEILIITSKLTPPAKIECIKLHNN